MYDWTEREAVEYIDAAYERQRREAKVRSVIAFREAVTVCTLIAGKEADVMSMFPFWTEEEQDEAKRQRLVRYMMSKVGKEAAT